MRFFEECGNSSSSTSRISSSSSSSRICSASDPSPSTLSDRICDEKWVVPDLRSNFFKSLVQTEPQQQQNYETGFVALKGAPEVKVVDFSLESLLQFKLNHAEHTAHENHEEKHRLRPAYDNRKRRFGAVQPVDRKAYLILAIIFFGYALSLF